MSPTGPQNTPAGPQGGPYGEGRGKHKQFEQPGMSPSGPQNTPAGPQGGPYGEGRGKHKAEGVNQPAGAAPNQPGQPVERKGEGKTAATPTPGPQ